MSHPCRYDLERFATGETDREVETHLEKCETCREYVGEIERERKSLLGRLPSHVLTHRIFARIEAKAPGYSPVFKWAAACATFIVIAFLAFDHMTLTPAVEKAEKGQPAGRWMGGEVGLRLFARRNDKTLEIGLNDAQPGDQLRYQVEVPDGEEGYAAVVAVEANRIFPVLPDDSRMGPYRFKAKAMLPGSVVVEQDTVSLDLIIYISSREFSLQSLLEKARRLPVDERSFERMDGVVFRQHVER